MVSRSTVMYEARVDIDGWGKERQAKYKYILLEGDMVYENSGEKVMLPCYGIEIVREDIKGNSVYAFEEDRIECMSVYKYKVVQLIKKLYINLVSPIHLIDIAGPFADEWAGDFDDQQNSVAVPQKI